MSTAVDLGPGLEARWFAFGELSGAALYEMLAFRQDIFIVEQASAFQDLDGKDPTCRHLAVWAADRKLAGYLRARGLVGGEPAFIGRIVVAPDHRGSGLGRRLVAEGLRFLAEHHPGQDVEIGAQRQLQRFYESFGFVREGDEYDDGGILHVTMWLRKGGGG